MTTSSNKKHAHHNEHAKLHAPEQYGSAPDLATLSELLGPATKTEVEALVEGADAATRVASGKAVSTTRVDKDALRIYAGAAKFLATEPKQGGDGATEDHRTDVHASMELLRICAWAALQGHNAFLDLNASTVDKASAEKVTEATANTTLASLRATRDHLAEMIRSAAGQSAAIESQVEAALHLHAAGAADAGPDASITKLVGIGKALLKDTSPGAVLRRSVVNFTEARLDACTAAVKTAKPVLAALATPVTKATSDSVDLWDGTNLLLIDRVHKLFATAHAKNPEVPDLGFVSLRSILGAKARTTKPAASEPTGPTPANGGTA